MTIYFIRAGRNVKIGHTVGDPNERLKALQTGNAKKLRLVASIPGDMEDEQRLHKRFASYRVSGEWFTFSIPIRSLVRSLRGWNLNEPDSAALLLQRLEPRLPQVEEIAQIIRVWPPGRNWATCGELSTALQGPGDDRWNAACIARMFEQYEVDVKPVRVGSRTDFEVDFSDIADAIWSLPYVSAGDVR